MNEPNAGNADNRLFGLLAIILLCLALLGPFAIAAFSHQPEMAIGFGIVSMVLALVFGIIGWRHKTGKVVVVTTGVLLGLVLIMALLALVVFQSRRVVSMKKELEMRTEMESRHHTALVLAGAVARAELQENMSPAEKARQMKLAQGDLKVAKNANERFCALGHAAKNAFNAGDTADAKKYAEELFQLTPQFKDDWNYGNAIQDANLVLGRLALAEGNLQEAKQRLLASAESNGSPQMNSFGPNMSLAKDLLAKGEKETVLTYFERCGKFWTMGTDRLKLWTEIVKKGETPDFGANLCY